MHTITHEDVQRFSTANYEQPVVSLYMPTHRVSGPDFHQDKINFKNSLSEAKKQLQSLGVRDQDIEQQLQPAEKLINDDYFWSHQDHGLAVLLTPDEHRIYQTPYHFDQLLAVSYRLHIKPLLPILGDTFYYYILAFSPNAVRLLRAKRTHVDELDAKELPSDITDALGEENDSPHLNFHTGTGGGGAIFHGHGDLSSYKKTELQKYVRYVGERLQTVIGDGQAQVVLACVDSLEAMFRKTFPSNRLHHRHLSGNFDETTAQELHQQTLPLITEDLEADWQRNQIEFEQLRQQHPERVSTDVYTVAEQLSHGAIKSLFVPRQPHMWGEYHDDGSIPRLQPDYVPGLSDISDALAAHAYTTGREVYVVDTADMPEDSPAAAIFYG